MISSVSWVRRGAALSAPKKCDLDDSKIDEISKRLNISLENLNEAEWQDVSDEDENIGESGDESDTDVVPNLQDLEIKSSQDADETDDLSRYNLDDYDKEDDAINPAMIIGNFQDMLYFGSKTDQDPYLEKGDSSDEEETAKDLEINPTDSLIVVANTVEEVSYLEVYLYDEGNDNLYVHHDLMIPSFPLCTEWLDCSVSDGSNFVAVGTFDPEIEIWNLDVLDTPVPETILGLNSQDKHSDSVMSLCWNRKHTNMLLSGSADETIKLWDLKTNNCLRTFNTVHSGKVQAVQWNPLESTQILSGSYDKTVCVFDARNAAEKMTVKLQCDPESVRWNPHCQYEFLIADENGYLSCFDTRNLSKSKFTLQAHSKAATGVDWNPFVPGLVVSLSIDKSAKLWNFAEEPEQLATKSFNIGKIFCGSFCQDAPHLFAMGGSKGELLLWNLYENSTFSAKYKALL